MFKLHRKISLKNEKAKKMAERLQELQVYESEKTKQTSLDVYKAQLGLI